MVGRFSRRALRFFAEAVGELAGDASFFFGAGGSIGFAGGGTPMNAIDEGIAGGGAAGSASACVECLTQLGLDPQLSAAVAVVLGVLVRLTIDYWREKRRNKESSDEE